MTRGVGLVGLRRVSEVGHAGVFESENKVNSDFSSIEGLGGALMEVSGVGVEVERSGVEVQCLQGEVL